MHPVARTQLRHNDRRKSNLAHIGGSTGPQCAGKIHSDFERGYIRAEVISYNDFVAAGSEVKAKENGKMRTEGKEYIMDDGDIVHFRFNV